METVTALSYKTFCCFSNTNSRHNFNTIVTIRHYVTEDRNKSHYVLLY